MVATDVSPRAVNFARFNCGLNAIANVECRTGDFLDAVAGSTFDLVLCNPPFVISPDHDVLFRDGGRPGDSLSRELVEAIPRHLNPRGLAQVLVSWACREGEGWSEPLQRWVKGSGCDVWLICVERQPALEHAASWNEHLASEPARQSEAFNRWADYFEADGIDTIGTGAVILRRRSGRNWMRMDEVRGFKLPGPARRSPASCGRKMPRSCPTLSSSNNGCSPVVTITSSRRSWMRRPPTRRAR